MISEHERGYHTSVDTRRRAEATPDRRGLSAVLPEPRGPLSFTVISLLSERAPHRHLNRIETSLGDGDPFGPDLQLALYICYELHYRGFAGVHPRWEWDPALLHLRARIEEVFIGAVGEQVGVITAADTPVAEMDKLSGDSARATGLSAYLCDVGTWAQVQEYFVHRSLYHLKEADPHAWVIPRLTGQAKASFAAVEFDEYGAGCGHNVHQELFADLLEAAGLDRGYLAYLDLGCAESLALVNVMSLLSLHRELRGAAVGHFAATEITSPPGSQRLSRALRRLDAPQACIRFYDEHVEADAVHEQVVRTDVVGSLLQQEPDLAADVVFGIRAFGLLEDRLEAFLLERWDSGQSSLRHPLLCR
jgi:Iron-containing redox enzyme